MTSLKAYPRERDLGQRLGDQQLVLPRDAELLRLVSEQLCTAKAPSPSSAELVFARWKPGQSVLGCWRVKFEDASERMVSWKSYAGPKASSVGSSYPSDKHMQEAALPLAPFAFLPEQAALLTCFPSDRILRGAARLLNMRRSGRLLDGAGLWPGSVMRRGASKIELLRYKPEHRAVLCLRAKLKQDREGPRQGAGQILLAVRVLSPAKAESVIANRRACPSAPLPQLLHAEVNTGLLFEEWVPGTPVAWNDFSQAKPAARILSQLHQVSSNAPARNFSRASALELLVRVPGLEAACAMLPELAPLNCSRWIHGDFHADQWTQTSAGLRLLDADGLRPGAPEEDLAAWVADQLQDAPELEFEAALTPLLEGYQEKAIGLSTPLIAQLTAEQLIHRAAAGIRRLQLGACEQAALLLERARCLTTEKISR